MALTDTQSVYIVEYILAVTFNKIIGDGNMQLFSLLDNMQQQSVLLDDIRQHKLTDHSMRE